MSYTTFIFASHFVNTDAGTSYQSSALDWRLGRTGSLVMDSACMIDINL